MMWEIDCLDDGTVVTCSQIIRNNGQEHIEVHFERPVYNGFDSARYVLPDHRWLFAEGYSTDEIRCFEEYIKQNEALLWHWGYSPWVRRIENDLCYKNDERSDEDLL